MNPTENHPFEDIEEIQDEITPPASPASPPGPPAPPSLLWNQTDFNFYTTMIQKHLAEIEKVVMGPHIIFIEGIQHLRPLTGQNWKDRINYLLFETRIPFFWILECVPDDEVLNEDESPEESDYPTHDTNIDCPQRVRLYLISYHVKTKIFHILKNFLRDEYNNVVYLD